MKSGKACFMFWADNERTVLLFACGWWKVEKHVSYFGPKKGTFMQFVLPQSAVMLDMQKAHTVWTSSVGGFTSRISVWCAERKFLNELHKILGLTGLSWSTTWHLKCYETPETVPHVSKSSRVSACNDDGSTLEYEMCLMILDEGKGKVVPVL